ncbi:MAG: tRNA preQ1(34) S-adenosylmethionine ribosyltransferase-isomerase QueA [Desulfamplus sp.]|nr:tRNA preQ1(34) S-adenosylmethionine ribosyltransferase-isomerase QueA [Desulfamplus sp.]
MYLLSDYVYCLPEDQIAQQPSENREDSRLLRLDKKEAGISHHLFKDIENLLKPDDLVVINNTRVIPARLKGHKESGGKVEVLILDYAGGMVMQEKNGYFECDCMIRASKSPKPGTLLRLERRAETLLLSGIKTGFSSNEERPESGINGKRVEFGNNREKVGSGDKLEARVECVNGAIFTVRFLSPCSKDFDFYDVLENFGEIPLPPYILRNDHTKNNNDLKHIDDKESYQTVYATEKGAVAAPTAGLHFTHSLMQNLVAKGIEFVDITLHVGYGTFIPVRVKDIREHQIHSEFFSIPEASAKAVNKAKSEGRRVIAVGTTSVRTLEYATDAQGKLHSGNGMCNLFIYPGYTFKMVDAMITNFHLPESTLLMLVSAFSGRDLILKAYKEAVDKKYRFFSYGDAMLLE